MKKVSLRELVADKIIFAVLIAVFIGCGRETIGRIIIRQYRWLFVYLAFTILYHGLFDSESIKKSPPTKWLRQI